MELLKKKIMSDGKVLSKNILKVDSFLNHQIDIELLDEIGKYFKKLFKDEKITKILTVEASGIAVAIVTALNFNVPVVFAKKGDSFNQDEQVYQSKAYSFTKGKSYVMNVTKDYLHKNDKVLIIDDFLANGVACEALIKIVKDANAQVTGIGIVIEKSFQEGRNKIEKYGFRIESLARIKKMDTNNIVFI